jgi:hypothetical protein
MSDNEIEDVSFLPGKPAADFSCSFMFSQSLLNLVENKQCDKRSTHRNNNKHLVEAM